MQGGPGSQSTRLSHPGGAEMTVHFLQVGLAGTPLWKGVCKDDILFRLSFTERHASSLQVCVRLGITGSLVFADLQGRKAGQPRRGEGAASGRRKHLVSLISKLSRVKPNRVPEPSVGASPPKDTRGCEAETSKFVCVRLSHVHKNCLQMESKSLVRTSWNPCQL